MKHFSWRRFFITLAGIGLLLPLCGGCAGGSSALQQDPPPAPAVQLPALPTDGPGWSHQISAVTTQTGVQAAASCGAPGAAPRVGYPDQLTLDGNLATGFAWAYWQFPLDSATVIQQFQINLQQSGPNKYWLAYADYDRGMWLLYEEKIGTTAFIPTTEQAAALHSPGEFAYIAILVGPGSQINVGTMAMTIEDPPPLYPIFDQFEDNDIMAEAYELTAPGLYHASIHETYRVDMPLGEEQDVWDFYKVPLLADQYLTITLRHEVFNHFMSLNPDFNDLDILFYSGPTEAPLDDFIEANSSMRIYYWPFEQCTYFSSIKRNIWIGIRADIPLWDPVDNDAEYYLGLYTADAVHSVSGAITVAGAQPDRDFAVFLDPGNFNAISEWEGDPDSPTPGAFSIPNVPDGEYTLKVHSSARYGPYNTEYPEELPVNVAGGDVSGLHLDLAGY